MASLVLVLAFFGMITGLTAGNEMMATARRQTLASKMIDHEIEALRFVTWDVSSSTNDIVGMSNSDTSVTSLVWSSSIAYKVRDLVVRNGTWYRCIANNTGNAPPNASYWTTDTPPYYKAFEFSGVASSVAEGATFTLTHTVASVSGLTNVKEVTFTITWTVQPSGGVATRTYTRKKSAYYGQYGLNLTYQRS